MFLINQLHCLVYRGRINRGCVIESFVINPGGVSDYFSGSSTSLSTRDVILSVQYVYFSNPHCHT